MARYMPGGPKRETIRRDFFRRRQAAKAPRPGQTLSDADAAMTLRRYQDEMARIFEGRPRPFRHFHTGGARL